MGMSGAADTEILKLVFSLGIVSKSVLIILLIFSIISWGIIFFKFYQMGKVERDTKKFLTFFARANSIFQFNRAHIKNMSSSLSVMFEECYGRVEKIRKEKRGLLSDRTAFLNSIDRTLKNTIQDELAYYENYLPFLATTGNIAPLLGLFGTVWGIVKSFQGIGALQTANIAAVAPGVAEALLTTAAGLGVAIPAVIGYNYFLNRLRKMSSKMEVFAGELIKFIEIDIDHPARISDEEIKVEDFIHGK